MLTWDKTNKTQIFLPAKNCCTHKICYQHKICCWQQFFASRNFCASSKLHVCAGSNFCASRNICVLFVLLLYVPKSITLAMARRSVHLSHLSWGSLKKRLTSTSSLERECLTRNREAAGSSPTDDIALCP